MNHPRVTIASVVEGEGEISALPVLLRRLMYEAQIWDADIQPPFLVDRGRLVRPGGLEAAVEAQARRVPADHPGGILVVIDADDDCPAGLGPSLLARAEAARPDRRTAVVLANRFPVCTREVRKRLWKSDQKVVYRRTGEAAWVVRYRIPDGGFHSGWRPSEHLGITDTAIGHVFLYGNHHGVGFSPFKQSDGKKAANWRPYIVSLFSALLDSRTSEVDHATGTEIQVLRPTTDR